MKIQRSPVRNQRGSTLMMVLLLTASTLLILASTLSWATTNVTLCARNNEYFRAVGAAEAATEKVIAVLESDYQIGGDAAVKPSLDNYRARVPLASEDAALGNYVFNDAQNNVGKTYLQFLPPTAFRVLTAQYRDLYGYSSIYRVISNARDATSRFNITGAVWQDVETATIPLFQFAIFYNIDLEINPGANMTVTGPVHGNQNLYLDPGATLTFQSHVTAAGKIIKEQKPGDPNTNRTGTLVFGGDQLPSSGISSLNLPIATNNTPIAVHEVVMPPPATGESSTSPMGTQRMYNKADVIVTVTDTGTTVTSGIINNTNTDITLSSTATNSPVKWLNTTRTLYNKRENKTVREVEIDVAQLVAWNSSASNNLPVRSGTSGTKDVTIVYVDDQRTMTSSQQTGVLVKNGHLLPPLGLTIATPEPLYVAGNYNVTDSSSRVDLLGSADTSHTKPAALIGDSITVLSSAWQTANPTYGSTNFSNRGASNTTVNAAFLAGIVETVSGSYSGGAENYPRFLEDWNGDTFTYNGSMVVMYPSQIATGLWQGTGSTIGIYDPPTRNWAFDTNFRDPAKLPPGTPAVRVLVRGAWAMIKPNTTSIVDPDALIP